MGEHNKKVCDIKMDDKNMGLVVLLLSVFAGGLGTIIAGFLQKDEECKKSAIIIGVVQWILSFVFVGWLWAIWTGFKIYKNSC